MWGYAEQRPQLEEGEVANNKTRSWTTVLMECRMPPHMQKPVGYLMHQLAASAEEVQQKKAINNVGNFLLWRRQRTRPPT